MRKQKRRKGMSKLTQPMHCTEIIRQRTGSETEAKTKIQKKDCKMYIGTNNS